jgi:hypothetical protein
MDCIDTWQGQTVGFGVNCDEPSASIATEQAVSTFWVAQEASLWVAQWVHASWSSVVTTDCEDELDGNEDDEI